MPTLTLYPQLLKKWASFQFIIDLQERRGCFNATAETQAQFLKLKPILIQKSPPMRDNKDIIEEVKSKTEDIAIDKICKLLLSLLHYLEAETCIDENTGIAIQLLDAWLKHTIRAVEDTNPQSLFASGLTERDTDLIKRLRYISLEQLDRRAEMTWQLLASSHIKLIKIKSVSFTRYDCIGNGDLSHYLHFNNCLIDSLVGALSYPEKTIRALTFAEITVEKSPQLDLRRLAHAINNSGIESLNLSQLSRTDTLSLDLLRQGLNFSHNRRLRHLALRDWRSYKRDDVHKLVAYISCSSIESLDLSASESLTRALFRHGLNFSDMSLLTKLTLCHWDNADPAYMTEDIRQLAEVLNKSHIQYLGLSRSTQLTQALITFGFDFSCHQTLQELTLGSGRGNTNNYNNDDLQKLSVMLHKSSVHLLDLSGYNFIVNLFTHGFKPNQLKTLKKLHFRGYSPIDTELYTSFCEDYVVPSLIGTEIEVRAWDCFGFVIGLLSSGLVVREWCLSSISITQLTHLLLLSMSNKPWPLYELTIGNKTWQTNGISETLEAKEADRQLSIILDLTQNTKKQLDLRQPSNLKKLCQDVCNRYHLFQPNTKTYETAIPPSAPCSSSSP